MSRIKKLLVDASLRSLDLIGSVGERALADAAAEQSAGAKSSADILDAVLKVVGVIVKVVRTLSAGYDGKITPEAVHAELDELDADLATNDAARVAAIDAKFPPTR